MLASLVRNQLLVIDEFGDIPIDNKSAGLLVQVIADGYEKPSMILITNLEFSRWDTVFEEPTMATAVINCIVHHGWLLQFRGEF